MIEWVRAARERGVVFDAGGTFTLDGAPAPGARLGFGCLTEDELSRAVKALRLRHRPCVFVLTQARVPSRIRGRRASSGLTSQPTTTRSNPRTETSITSGSSYLGAAKLSAIPSIQSWDI